MPLSCIFLPAFLFGLTVIFVLFFLLGSIPLLIVSVRVSVSGGSARTPALESSGLRGPVAPCISATRLPEPGTSEGSSVCSVCPAVAGELLFPLVQSTAAVFACCGGFGPCSVSDVGWELHGA